ncbi:SPARC-related modular calcium-binding protein 1 isoform X1 [Dendroctonus ponderosae]|uniref:SPARC-related modular calcium-binding protein 2 n=1 Tax=Dendroctonus ponderosae TaxID=77166 RepID=A0AAR5P6Y7_DENPD|nr:SPARC-related modular calcium-binding protein 1 isoform X1 [Dendroctonus ponderosae]
MRPARNICLGFLVICVIWKTHAAEETSDCNPKACQKTDNQKVVCGSDGLSYPNRCQLERVRCQNKHVTLVKRGPCRKQRTCFEWQDFSLDFPQYKFKAKCKNNGAYEPGQCHPESNYCWCVTPQGIPLPDTVKERNSKPGSKPIRCGGGSRKKIPRSPSRRTKNRSCKQPEKALLNNNLMNTFHSEYVREFGRNNSDDDTVIKWRFAGLDTNHDSYLEKKEYRDLKRLVAKAIRPKKCAKTFPKSCDVNNDALLSFQEWKGCLARDGHTVLSRLLFTLKTDSPPHDNNEDNDRDDGERDYSDTFDSMPSSHYGALNTGLPLGPSSGTNYDDELIDTREEESPNCLSDRKSAIEDGSISGHVHNATYIPECTSDGRYKKVQCYESVGYCWCVNEDNGQTVAGTAVKGNNPNCDVLKPMPKPMKGCPDDKKLIFLQELMQFLRTKMSESATPNNPAGSLALIQSKEEEAFWSFNFLDKNHNRVLERSEWKAFKDMVGAVKTMRKCGKKLPRYCDSNKDKEISTTEWLDCLNVHGIISAQQNVAKPSSRFGKTNPLSLLQDD